MKKIIITGANNYVVKKEVKRNYKWTTTPEIYRRSTNPSTSSSSTSSTTNPPSIKSINARGKGY